MDAVLGLRTCDRGLRIRERNEWPSEDKNDVKDF